MCIRDSFIPMGQLGFIISLMAQAGASAERIFEILDTKNDVENKPGAVDVSTVEGRVEFRDVTFRYFQGSEPVLNDISFSAEPGQTVALLGATGSGKSSIINLIPRFYDVSEGQVLIDGHDVRDLTPVSYTHLDVYKRQHQQFLQEASILAQLDHPNLPKVSDFFSDDSRDYLVMDFVPGHDLRELLQASHARGEKLDAVSYTHLDVYKRQVCSVSMRPSRSKPLRCMVA